MPEQLFKVANWPEQPGVAKTEDPALRVWSRRVDEWAAELTRILDHTLTTQGAMVSEAVEEHPYPPTRVLYAGADGQITCDAGFSRSGNDVYQTADAQVVYYQTAYSDNAALPTKLIQRRARGTVAGPSAVLANYLLAANLWQGYTGTAFRSSARQTVYSLENFVEGSAYGTYMYFELVPVGGTEFGGALRLVASQAQVPDGGVGAPGLGFINDTDTGICRLGTNILGIIAGGAECARFTISGGHGLLTLS